MLLESFSQQNVGINRNTSRVRSRLKHNLHRKMTQKLFHFCKPAVPFAFMTSAVKQRYVAR
jgi:hypothetical protein